MNSVQGNPLIEALKHSGARITTQRIAICSWLLEHKALHPAVAEIYDALRGEIPAMSLATVYNTVSALVSLGLLQEVGKAQDGSSRYDVNLEPHINLVCLSCGKIVDHPGADIRMFDAVVKAHHFTLYNVTLAIHGLCEDCQRGQNAS